MSTRATIARRTASGFAGVYHHWDGYPEGLGDTLFRSLWEWKHRRYQAIEEWARLWIDGHPGGWSNFPDLCYCHDPSRKDEGDMKLTELNAAACGCEWAYAVGTDNGRDFMDVFASYCGQKMPSECQGQKMIGAFGVGDESAFWLMVCRVWLDEDDPPSWDQIHANAMEMEMRDR